MRPQLESLESRTTPSVTANFYDTIGGTLYSGVVASPAQVGSISGDAALNGVDLGFPASTVGSIRLQGDNTSVNAISVVGVDSTTYPSLTALTAVGGSQLGSLTVDDSASTSSATYTLTGVYLIRSIGVKISYAQMSSFAVDTPSGNTTFTASQVVTSLSLTVNGGAGNNTLVGTNRNATWTLSSPGVGSISASLSGPIAFDGFNALHGGSAADTFVLGYFAGTVPTINGGAGVNTLDMSAATTNLVWDVTANNAGTVAGVAFSSCGNLKSGSGDDDFVLSDGVGITGWLDAGGGTNTLDYSAYKTQVAVNLATGQATNIGGGIKNDSIQVVIYP